MSPTTPRKPLILAVHPNFSGFGWAALEGPFSPHDWGVARVRIDKNVGCLKRIELLIKRLQPEVIVLEAFEKHASARRERITKLCRAIVAMAHGQGIEVSVQSRADIRATFSDIGAFSRHAIAEAVGRQIPLLTDYVPKRRRDWETEPHRMAVFSAIAAALAHYRLSCDTLLGQMPSA